MQFNPPLQEALLLRRYKRFLADVRLPNGEEITVHTANTGSMLGCSTPGSRVWISDSGNPKRKHRHSWELVEVAAGTLVGINTALPNTLVSEAIRNGTIGELQGYERIRQEVRYGRENSRIDLLLEHDARAPCYVEIKNVTATDGRGYAIFPDAVSARGSKHLRELMGVVADGDRAMLCFCVQRGDVDKLRPADAIDPVYGRTLREAQAAGVEVIAYAASPSPQGIELHHALPVEYPPLT